ncbi:mucin-2-like [Engraulis encrasicolus]|uniref:mucin-2-like n=1 Tax=Engraulis encrasicolus TaxID=184585 RepID=UPI002FD11955
MFCRAAEVACRRATCALLLGLLGVLVLLLCLDLGEERVSASSHNDSVNPAPAVHGHIAAPSSEYLGPEHIPSVRDTNLLSKPNDSPDHRSTVRWRRRTARWGDGEPAVHCGDQLLRVFVRREDVRHLQVFSGSGVPLALSHLPGGCGIRLVMTSSEAILISQYTGCFMTQQGSEWVLWLRWFGRLVRASCPAPKATPPPAVTCQHQDMAATFTGHRLQEALSIRVGGSWLPLLDAMAWCGMEADVTPQGITITAAYTCCAVTEQDGHYLLSIQVTGRDVTVSCPADILSYPASSLHGPSHSTHEPHPFPDNFPSRPHPLPPVTQLAPPHPDTTHQSIPDSMPWQPPYVLVPLDSSAWHPGGNPVPSVASPPQTSTGTSSGLEGITTTTPTSKTLVHVWLNDYFSNNPQPNRPPENYEGMTAPDSSSPSSREFMTTAMSSGPEATTTPIPKTAVHVWLSDYLSNNQLWPKPLTPPEEEEGVATPPTVSLSPDAHFEESSTQYPPLVTPQTVSTTSTPKTAVHVWLSGNPETYLVNTTVSSPQDTPLVSPVPSTASPIQTVTTTPTPKTAVHVWLSENPETYLENTTVTSSQDTPLVTPVLSTPPEKEEGITTEENSTTPPPTVSLDTEAPFQNTTVSSPQDTPLVTPVSSTASPLQTVTNTPTPKCDCASNHPDWPKPSTPPHSVTTTPAPPSVLVTTTPSPRSVVNVWISEHLLNRYLRPPAQTSKPPEEGLEGLDTRTTTLAASPVANPSEPVTTTPSPRSVANVWLSEYLSNSYLHPATTTIKPPQEDLSDPVTPHPRSVANVWLSDYLSKPPESDVETLVSDNSNPTTFRPGHFHFRNWRSFGGLLTPDAESPQPPPVTHQPLLYTPQPPALRTTSPLQTVTPKRASHVWLSDYLSNHPVFLKPTTNPGPVSSLESVSRITSHPVTTTPAPKTVANVWLSEYLSNTYLRPRSLTSKPLEEGISDTGTLAARSFENLSHSLTATPTPRSVPHTWMSEHLSNNYPHPAALNPKPAHSDVGTVRPEKSHSASFKPGRLLFTNWKASGGTLAPKPEGLQPRGANTENTLQPVGTSALGVASHPGAAVQNVAGSSTTAPEPAPASGHPPSVENPSEPVTTTPAPQSMANIWPSEYLSNNYLPPDALTPKPAHSNVEAVRSENSNPVSFRPGRLLFTNWRPFEGVITSRPQSPQPSPLPVKPPASVSADSETSQKSPVLSMASPRYPVSAWLRDYLSSNYIRPPAPETTKPPDSTVSDSAAIFTPEVSNPSSTYSGLRYFPRWIPLRPPVSPSAGPPVSPTHSPAAAATVFSGSPLTDTSASVSPTSQGVKPASASYEYTAVTPGSGVLPAPPVHKSAVYTWLSNYLPKHGIKAPTGQIQKGLQSPTVAHLQRVP